MTGLDNDIVLTLTVTGSVSPACYKLTVMTDKNTYSAQTNAAGTAAISQTNGQYSDNTVITLEVQKTCSTSMVEDVSYYGRQGICERRNRKVGRLDREMRAPPDRPEADPARRLVGNRRAARHRSGAWAHDGGVT